MQKIGLFVLLLVVSSALAVPLVKFTAQETSQYGARWYVLPFCLLSSLFCPLSSFLFLPTLPLSSSFNYKSPLMLSPISFMSRILCSLLFFSLHSFTHLSFIKSSLDGTSAGYYLYKTSNAAYVNNVSSYFSFLL